MKGFKNRKSIPLPKHRQCKIAIVTTDGVRICNWFPFNPKNYTVDNMPAEGYLGTARTIDSPIQIGFHAWQQNDSEFLFYKRVY